MRGKLLLLSLRNETNVLSYSEPNLSVSKGYYIKYLYSKVPKELL